MPSHQFIYPKVQPVKVTSAHRKTEVHPVVSRSEEPKAPRRRAEPRP